MWCHFETRLQCTTHVDQVNTIPFIIKKLNHGDQKLPHVSKLVMSSVLSLMRILWPVRSVWQHRFNILQQTHSVAIGHANSSQFLQQTSNLTFFLHLYLNPKTTEFGILGFIFFKISIGPRIHPGLTEEVEGSLGECLQFQRNHI